MSFAFRRHDYDLSQFDHCEEHGCVMVQVAYEARPRCLMDWLIERAGGRQVLDIIPRDRGEYDLPALILDNGFLLPVKQVLDAASQQVGEVNLSLAGWEVAEIIYVHGGNERCAVELLPPGAADEDPGVLLKLQLDILIYLLTDAEVRKYEPGAEA